MMSLSRKGNYRVSRKPYSRKERSKEGARSTVQYSPTKLSLAMVGAVDKMLEVESQRSILERQIKHEMKKTHKDVHHIAELQRKISKLTTQLTKWSKIHRALSNERDKDL